MSQPHWNNNQFNVRAAGDTALTNQSMKAAPGAGMSIYVTDICWFSGATARACNILDGSGGTILWTVSPAIALVGEVHFRTPLKLSDATALCATSAGSSVGSYLTINGFVARTQ